MKKIDAKIKTIFDILTPNNKFYRIPEYQRAYSWNKDNLDALITDLVETFNENEDEEYFCGSLVLVENKTENRLDIIDGQQRITTFIIMACVIREKYGEQLGDQAKRLY